MSHSCIISEAKSALEVSEASEASAEGALAAAKLANRHVKKILGAATLAENLEAVMVGDMGEGEEGAGMMRDLMLRQGPFTSIRERSSPDISTSQLSLLLDFNAHKKHSIDLDVVLCNFDSIRNNKLRACCELGGDI